MIRARQKRYVGKLLVIGCPKNRSCTSIPIRGHIYSVVHPEAVEPLLEELLERKCGSHTGGWSLAHRALTQGYWWSSMHKTS